ncbi:hypothetical protein RQP46_005269 [Phenoliferia psychrophenolica]
MDILPRASPNRPRSAFPRVRPTPYPYRILEPSFLPRPRRPPPRLPAELIALIIDNINSPSIDPTNRSAEDPDLVQEDRKRLASLHSCLLVSKSFYGPALATLYRILDLDFQVDDFKDPTTKEVSRRFQLGSRPPILTILESPHLATFVREVRIEITSQAGKSHKKEILKYLIRVFSALGSLDYLDLYMLDAGSGDTQSALGSLQAVTPRLRKLYITLPKLSPHKMIKTSKSLWDGLRHKSELKHLVLDTEDSPLVAPDQPLDLHLTELELLIDNPSVGDVVSYILKSSHTSLRRLILIDTVVLPDLAEFGQLAHLTWRGALSSASPLLAQLPNISTLQSLDLSLSTFSVNLPPSSILTLLPDS